MSIDNKFKVLQESIASMERVVIAFSAGVDSTFLLKTAVDVLGCDNVLACINIGPLQPEKQVFQARKLAQSIGVKLIEVDGRELDYPDLCENNPDRCYICKKKIFGALVDLASEKGIKYVLCGHNLDDMKDFRPGNRAVKELDVGCPLSDAGMTKNDIRQLSRIVGLETADQPANPCLASRIPYRSQITGEKLVQIDKAEQFLEKLGLSEFRVRHHGQIARIEVCSQDIAKIACDNRLEVQTYFKSLGFQYVTLDLQGFRSGAMNEVLDQKEIKENQ